MRVFYKPSAQKTIDTIVGYVDSINTPNSGKKFALKLETFVDTFAQEGVVFNLCNHISLQRHNYSCIFFDKWIIVFKIKGNSFIVYRIIWGPALH